MGRVIAVFIAVLAFLALIVGRVAVFRRPAPSHGASAAGGSVTAPPFAAATKSRERESPDLSLEALCARLSKAWPTSDMDAIYRAIRRDLDDLTADEIVGMLDQLATANCAATGTTLEVLLLDLLGKKEPSLTADHLLASCKAGDINWDFFSSSFFEQWIQNDAAAATAWLDEVRRTRLPEDSSLVVVVRGEIAVLVQLLEKDPAAAMNRGRSFTPNFAALVIDAAFRKRSELLAPDQAIEFLRDGLGRENHEALVGHVCGTQLYSKGPDDMREFFRKHAATLPEREAIIREAAQMKVRMGFGGDAEAFLSESRQFAEEEGPGAVDHITAVILGETSDRDREDRKAVDLLLGFNPDDDALRTFLEIRGASIDKAQRLRIEERLSPP
ncbi:hypothetical protein OKA05_14205 [Luteolibacter arcticus]|uniref:Annexin n=1 Tax=Luteolibacter arcticus TaxID=1581411 RepID=A0ABT3GJL7_9BACT|nr:hypothetical protein [Luteolibacter arcticus]MCW1923715.1 hypothetical protein [Luteolibacter arcticus]